jgi:cell wall-associated NlpC family hydrolase
MKAVAVPAALVGAGLFAALAAVLGMLGQLNGQASCTGAGTAGIVLLTPGSGTTVGATEHGGPGDPSSGTVGSSGISLTRDPDSYAELGGTDFQSATALGGLPYGTPLRITWGAHSTIAYKRDIGLGGGPIDGYPRAIDLWWQLAGGLGIPYEDGLWSGPVRIERPPLTGAGNTLEQTPPVQSGQPDCAVAGLPVLTAGARATLQPNGTASVPKDAPAAVRGMIEAGNQIVGKPYVYGGGHSGWSPQSGYDCSGFVSAVLHAGGYLSSPVDTVNLPNQPGIESGPGQYVTIYDRPLSGQNGHVIIELGGQFYESGGMHGAWGGGGGVEKIARPSDSYLATFTDVLHPAGL